MLTPGRSQVSIAFGRPSLLNIGDGLRQELTSGIPDNGLEQISVFSYLISLQLMQIHSALVASSTRSHRPGRTIEGDGAKAMDMRRDLDDWLVRWKKWLATLTDDEDKGVLTSWGTLKYHQAVFSLSLLWPTGSKASNVCQIMAEAGLRLARHQQLFAHPFRQGQQAKPPLVFPWSWTSSHALASIGIRALNEGERTGLGDDTPSLETLRQFNSWLYRMEADPCNMMTGFSYVLDELRSRDNT